MPTTPMLRIILVRHGQEPDPLFKGMGLQTVPRVSGGCDKLHLTSPSQGVFGRLSGYDIGKCPSSYQRVRGCQRVALQLLS